MIAKVDPASCIFCGICIDECKAAAIFFSDGMITIVEEDCTACGECTKCCVMGAITLEK